MFTRKDSRVILILAAVLFVGTAVNLYERFRQSEKLEPSLLLKSGGAKAKSLDYVRSTQTATEPDKTIDSAAALPEKPETKEKIGINSAGASELISISGIGPVLAGRLVEYREKNGGFRDADELMKVKGIGPKSIEKILPQIKFD